MRRRGLVFDSAPWSQAFLQMGCMQMDGHRPFVKCNGWSQDLFQMRWACEGWCIEWLSLWRYEPLLGCVCEAMGLWQDDPVSWIITDHG